MQCEAEIFGVSVVHGQRGTRSLLSIVDISNNVMMNGSIPDATVQAMPNLAYLSLAGTYACTTSQR